MPSDLKRSLLQQWDSIQPGQSFRTPTGRKGFSLTSITPEKVVVCTQGGTPIEIKKEAFLQVLQYLKENNHNKEYKALIHSNKDINKAGPLCVAARTANGVNIMVITYILPILVQLELVQVDKHTPTTTWLL